MWVAGLRDSAVLRLAPAGLNSSVYGYTCMTVCIGIRHDEKVSLHSLYNSNYFASKTAWILSECSERFPSILETLYGLIV